ncbi:MAG: hypothetical protein AABY13_04915 [Nanoarchaeota archaeon]
MLRRPTLRKAQGMSINVIVVAALALLVLVVLSIIFLGRGKLFQSGLNQCKGTCVPKGQSCPQPDSAQVPTSNCDDGRTQVADGICCIEV